jgi:AcrR family transcriptional regulator
VRQVLFDTAMSLFRKKGFGRTSVDEIAEQAGFSRATYFYHFRSKRGVLLHYGQQLLARMEQRLACADAGSGPLERIRLILFEMAHDAEREREDLKLVVQYSLSDPHYFERPSEARVRVLETLTRLVEEAQGRGEARRDLSPGQQAQRILALYEGAAASVVMGVSSAAAEMKMTWQFILGGISGTNPKMK